MKITINAILPEGMELAQDILPSELNLESENIHYPEKVHVKASAQRSKDILTVDCDISATTSRECSKCLCEFKSNFNKQENFIYNLSGEHVIDLNDNIKDSIIVDYPIRMLCKEDCKGLCASCGKNLNEGSCSCTEAKV